MIWKCVQAVLCKTFASHTTWKPNHDATFYRASESEKEKKKKRRTHAVKDVHTGTRSRFFAAWGGGARDQAAEGFRPENAAAHHSKQDWHSDAR